MSFGNFKEVQFRSTNEPLRVVTSFEVDRINTKVSPSGLTPNIAGLWHHRWEVFRNGEWMCIAESRTVTMKEGLWNCYRKAEENLYPGDTSMDRLDRKLIARGSYVPELRRKQIEQMDMEAQFMPKGNKFWTLLVEGSNAINGNFDTREAAAKAAESETSRTGKKTYVLEAVSVVGLPQPKVEWSDLEAPVIEEPKAAYTPGEVA